jgi:hypothetical protein
MVVVTNATVSDEGPAPLLGRDGQVDMMNVRQRETAEDGVAVSPLLQLDVGLKRPMRQLQAIGQHIYLPVVSGPGHSIIHFLQEHHVWLAVLNRFDHAPWPVPAVHTPDTLVDVIGDQSKLHHR